MALQLKKRDITRVRPLLGGLDAWVERGYPVEKIALAEVHAQTALLKPV